MLIEVTCSELRNAASNISKANESFREAAEKLQQAGTELTDIWAGDTRDRFVSGMEQRKTWYEQMATIVDDYVTMMNNIAEKYEEMDAKGAALVRK